MSDLHEQRMRDALARARRAGGCDGSVTCRADAHLPVCLASPWTPELRDLRYLDERDRRREGSWDD